jgi:hypothetical protein
MSRGHANALRSLSIEAYRPQLFEEDLTAKEAAKRIEALPAFPNSDSRIAQPG